MLGNIVPAAVCWSWLRAGSYLEFWITIFLLPHYLDKILAASVGT